MGMILYCVYKAPKFNIRIIMERRGKSNTQSPGENMTKTEKILLILTAAFLIAALFLLPRGSAARQAEETFVLPGPSPAAASGEALTVTLETVIDINAADAAELTALPGVGPATAAAIVAYRDEHGPFASLEELLAVPGFGTGTLDAIRSAAGDGP